LENPRNVLESVEMESYLERKIAMTALKMKKAVKKVANLELERNGIVMEGTRQ
jgi:hypothetical protein